MLETLLIDAPYLAAKSSSGSNLPCTLHLGANQIWAFFCSFTLVLKLCCFWMSFVNVSLDKFLDVAECLFKPSFWEIPDWPLLMWGINYEFKRPVFTFKLFFCLGCIYTVPVCMCCFILPFKLLTLKDILLFIYITKI